MENDLPIDALKAIAHPVRLTILRALRDGERNVGEIEQAGDIGQPGLSQQLAVLRQAGLVSSRRDGKMVFYEIDQSLMSMVVILLTEFLISPEKSASVTKRPSPVGVANFARITTGS